jgi:malonyl-CoA/methylmalonyl-CoA synthetase
LIGVSYSAFGEVGVIVVIAKPGAALQDQAVVAALKSQLINFKIAKRCFVMAELPSTHGQRAKEPAARAVQGFVRLS